MHTISPLQLNMLENKLVLRKVMTSSKVLKDLIIHNSGIKNI
jgi:hypothetical protein